MSAVLDDNIGFDDPIEEANQTRSSDRNSVAIAQDIGRVQNALSEFDRVAAGLAAIEARYPKDAVYEVGTSKGLKDATEHRAAWRDPRITVEKARKMAKAPLLALGKSIDARAAWITAKLLEGEEPIDQLIKAEEARREQEKQARINAEAGRILGIQEALAEIGQDVLIASSKASSDIQALLDKMTSEQPDPLVFQEMIDQARTAWTAGITKLETALKAKLWDEAEQRRVAAEQAAEAERREQEAVRMEAQRLENERIAAEQRAQAERLAAERAEFERQKAELSAAQAELEERERIAQQNAEREQREAQERAAAEACQTQEAEALAEQDTTAQDSQQVLKAEAETPEATDRDAPASTSPSVGSMGAGQPADAGPAIGRMGHSHMTVAAAKEQCRRVADSCNVYFDDLWKTEGEVFLSDADAMLKACGAHELLEALRLCIDRLEPAITALEFEAVDAARAAIKKATGATA